jgi:predicted house-cleaning noncanonical NTP pyrophosphatase (MazG superfamily)
MIKSYHKLVRDKIPEIIQKDGKTCEVVTLSDKDYLDALHAKLGEELKEYQEDYSLEELADLQEVVDAIVKAEGLTPKEFAALQEKKRQSNGGFGKKLMLISVDDHKGNDR